MDLHDLHSLIAGAKPAFSATPPHFMPGAHHPPPPGYAATAPLPEQYHLLLAGGSGGVGEVDLPPTPLQPQPQPPPLPPQQQQPPGMENFAFFDTAFGGGAGGGGQGRWPRQETLTLLEVRSRLDSKFREAAHKGPLWDEVSRIMAEEHGYERSGKKCREKLENLYKYYKKTKEGKAGRQDGKHYRFFRQLEALYGGSSCNASTEIHQPYAKPAFIASHLPPSRQVKLSAAYHTSLSNSPSGFSESSSSDDNGDDDDEDEDEELLKMGGKSWRSKVAELIDAQIKRFVEVQEAWMNEMLQTLEHMEQARISREEDRRRQEAARFDRECSIWAGERAWIEARDAAIIQALEKISHRRTQQQEQQLRGREEDESSPSPESCWHGQFIANGDGDPTASTWAEAETASLIKIRSGMEAEFRREGGRRGWPDATLWEHVSAAMSCLGYTRSAMRCKERWEDLNRLSSTSKSAAMNCCGKKRRKNSKMTTSKLQENSCSERSEGGDEEEQRSDLVGLGIGDEGTASHSSYVNGVDDESSFLFSVGQDEGCLWENNGVRNGRGDGS